MKKNWIQMAIMAVALATAGGVQATIAPAISFQDGFTGSLHTYTLGFEFTPNINISVTQLGFYDRDNNGLLESHAVGIFKTSDTSLVISTTVAPSDPVIGGDASNGYYHYHLLGTPVALSAGTTYRIAGVVNDTAAPTSDSVIPYQAFTGFANDPNLTLGGGWYITSSTLVFPTSTAAGQIYAAPNFLFDVPVPEPSTIMLLGLGGLLLLRRRRNG